MKFKMRWAGEIKRQNKTKQKTTGDLQTKLFTRVDNLSVNAAA